MLKEIRSGLYTIVEGEHEEEDAESVGLVMAGLARLRHGGGNAVSGAPAQAGVVPGDAAAPPVVGALTPVGVTNETCLVSVSGVVDDLSQILPDGGVVDDLSQILPDGEDLLAEQLDESFGAPSVWCCMNWQAGTRFGPKRA